jgi:hypothetical protein
MGRRQSGGRLGGERPQLRRARGALGRPRLFVWGAFGDEDLVLMSFDKLHLLTSGTGAHSAVTIVEPS